MLNHAVRQQSPRGKDIMPELFRVGQPVGEGRDAFDKIRLPDVLFDLSNNGASDDGAVRLLPDRPDVLGPRNTESDGDRRGCEFA